MRIMSHQITLEEYKLLLLQNYVAYTVTETEISSQLPEFQISKSTRLHKDLLNLKLNTSLPGNYKDLFKVKNRAEALGAAYVVEGSSLGGMMISSELKNCPDLVSIEKHNFFSGERQNVNGWKKFCSALKKENFTLLEEKQAIDKAKETFLFFGKIFREVQLQRVSR